ncbi:citrate/2-methylcitrate synthase, partial [Staphylococcus epidermidis]|uniref:citrate/2-methylcitrate synthase n=1 Tax=Staphylococcus epidermidis TaxID=1282 RepID=UPI0037DA6DCF
MSLPIHNTIKQQKPLIPNLHFFTPTLYHTINIPHHLFTPIFPLTPTSPCIPHILHQYPHNTIIRPTPKYIPQQNPKYL